MRTAINARVLIADSFAWYERDTDIYLGADFLKADRLIIVPDHKALPYTCAGGSLFRTDNPRQDSARPLRRGAGVARQRASATE